ncbi:MAG: molecular chaperone HtpG [Verrucomicrobiales bacterium]
MSEIHPQPFQAEVRQLLDIVIHSLYTDREIFIRELVSNASDAMEKLRHAQLAGGAEIYEPELPLEISITTDEGAKSLTIADHGSGLNREELAQNLGTIAHSGTKAFLQALKESGGSTPGSLIGKFGVGFYSVFMVAQRVRVYTHSVRPDGEHLVWTSDGANGFTIEEAPGQSRGARVVIELKEEAHEFAQAATVRRVLEKYSNFVPFPILLNGERVNTVEALWLKPKSEVTDEQYAEFYKFACKAWDAPRFRLHFAADAPLQINALLFVPTDNPEKFGFGQTEPGVALYCRRVLIDAQPPDFLPEWMRFVRGVVDSEDLPLNISRETMQDSALVRKLGDVIAGRVLKLLEQQAAEEGEKYGAFYKDFARFIKEGAVNDFRHREALAKLLRFESSLHDAGQITGLADYVTRMKDGQEAIYFQVAPNRAAIEAGPYLEAFKARGLEVLFAYEPLDDYVMTSLREFDGKKLVSVTREDVKLDDVPVETAGEPLPEAEVDALSSWLKETLGGAVTDVAGSGRLVEAPVVALTPEHAPTPQMRVMMRALQQEVEPVRVKLEINPRHPMIKSLAAARTAQPDLAALAARQLLDNALLAAGLLEDPRDMVQRLNDLVGRALSR